MSTELVNAIWYLGPLHSMLAFPFDFQNNKHFEFTLESISEGQCCKNIFRIFNSKSRQFLIPDFIEAKSSNDKTMEIYMNIQSSLCACLCLWSRCETALKPNL